MDGSLRALSPQRFRRVRGLYVPTTQFGAWTGTNQSAQLVDQFGRTLNAALPFAIYRNDWQGNQLLYPTPRTTFFSYSQSNYAADWNYASTVSVISETALAPDGSLTAGVFQETTAGGNYVTTPVSTGQFTPGIYEISICVSPYQTANTIYCYLNNVAGSIECSYDFSTSYFNAGASPAWTATPLPNGFIKLSTVYNFTAINQIQITPYWPQPTLGSGGVVIWGPMFGGGVYIPNPGNTPVTITDYTLTGTTVNLAQAPAATAVTTWNGRAL